MICMVSFVVLSVLFTSLSVWAEGMWSVQGISSVVVLVVVCVVNSVSCTVQQLDESVPFVSSRGTPVRWNSGWDAFDVASNLCVRVNSRGVFLKPQHWTLWTPGLSSAWDQRRCDISTSALCAAGRGRILPYSSPPVFDPGFSFLQTQCSRDNSGRLLVSSGRYDISMCDILDSGWDVAYCGEVLYVKQTALNYWVYILVCLLSVFVVRSFGYMVYKRVDSAAAGNLAEFNFTDSVTLLNGKLLSYVPDSETATVCVCFILVVIVLVPDFGAVYITTEEILFVCSLVLYLAVYFFLWLTNRHGSDTPIYNLMAGTLQLVVCRLYCAVETPYNSLLAWVVCTRFIVKLMGNIDFVMTCSVVMDACLLGLMSCYSVQLSFLYVCALVVLSLCVADAIQGKQL